MIQPLLRLSFFFLSFFLSFIPILFLFYFSEWRQDINIVVVIIIIIIIISFSSFFFFFFLTYFYLPGSQRCKFYQIIQPMLERRSISILLFVHRFYLDHCLLTVLQRLCLTVSAQAFVLLFCAPTELFLFAVNSMELVTLTKLSQKHGRKGLPYKIETSLWNSLFILLHTRWLAWYPKLTFICTWWNR